MNFTGMNCSSKNFCCKICLFVVALLPLLAHSQYYYKDILSTGQINKTFERYSANKITHVTLHSFNGSTPVTEGFTCWQKVSYRPGQIITYTKTSGNGESWLTATYNDEGLLIKTVDSTGESVSRSFYRYDIKKQLTQLRNETAAADKSSFDTEVHNWMYNDKGKPKQMMRIKNGKDTTLITFTPDEKGNPGEEEAFRKGVSQGRVYYYYDGKGHLTDVVRYNIKAARLLPDYMFGYEDNGELSTMTVVPEGSSDYQKWYYKYDEDGLKLADFCYNKKNELQGKVEYEYKAAK
ncbi:MAG TPA: hypothetical protein VJ647_03295 [Chitinophagaceae bacterium]|nr:hypothetical protein [Chitinophagaceae bacterium]